jgi:tetratricopeptide (TPR) repeat protein
VKDVDKLEREWMDFIQGIPIDAPLARFKRGLDAITNGGLGEKAKSQRAMADLDAAIEGGVDDPRAFWARAMINLITTGKDDKSVADLRKAIELAPLEAGFRVNLAQILAGVTVRTRGLSVSNSDEEQLEGSEDALVEAEQHFGIACELDPDNEGLREARDRFHELLARKGEGK